MKFLAMKTKIIIGNVKYNKISNMHSQFTQRMLIRRTTCLFIIIPDI